MGIQRAKLETPRQLRRLVRCRFELFSITWCENNLASVNCTSLLRRCSPLCLLFPRIVSHRQLACHGLATMFITRRTLCLIACDTSKFGARRRRLTDEEQLEIDIEELEALEVCHWLKVLSWRVPGCNILLVGTKCDLLPPEDIEDVGERIEAACRAWAERWELRGMNVNLEPGVVLTSCVTPSVGEAALGDHSASLSANSAEMGISSRARKKQMPTVSEGRHWPSDFGESPDNGCEGLQHRITHTAEGMSRPARMTVPRGWDIALTVLDALSAGRRVYIWVPKL